MARLFPLRSETPAREGPPRVVDLDGEDADAVFGALSSNTARRIYARLDEEPGTPSDLAEAIDSSIQNVRYHLEKLEDAGLVEVVDTWYSSRGNEMSVYATANGPLIVTSDRSRAAQLKEALSRFVGGVGLLGVGSLLVQAAAQRFGPVGMAGNDAAGSDGSGDEPTGGESGGTDAGDGGGGGDDVTSFDAQGGEDDAETTDGADSAADDPGSSDASTADDGQPSGDGSTGDDSTGDGSTGDDSLAPDGGEDSIGVLDAFTDGAVDLLDGFFSWLSPGLAFFLGGLVVLAVVGAWWYWRTYETVELGDA